jgi:polysaccharide deacetylase family protein (PEP-CTERM system associated)
MKERQKSNNPSAQSGGASPTSCLSTFDSRLSAALPTSSAKCIFSVDVEDWFHILDLPSTPGLSTWDSLPSRVESNFRRLLEIFSEAQVHVTCFFLGWVAQRFPHLVREADRSGHEVASHGYAHRLIYEMTPQEFYEDAFTSKRIIEDIVGHPIWGYRASGFSVTERTPWFFDKLMEAGYRYDSSVFPAPRGHGGLKNGHYAPYWVGGSVEGLIEFPITVIKVLGKPVCFSGGGYLRLFPFSLIKRMVFHLLEQDRPVIFYVHPREIDPHHPRLPMGLRRRFKCYFNLKTAESKIRRVLSAFEVMTFRDFLAEQFIPSVALGQPGGGVEDSVLAGRAQ